MLHAGARLHAGTGPCFFCVPVAIPATALLLPGISSHRGFVLIYGLHSKNVGYNHNQNIKFVLFYYIILVIMKMLKRFLNWRFSFLHKSRNRTSGWPTPLLHQVLPSPLKPFQLSLALPWLSTQPDSFLHNSSTHHLTPQILHIL